MRRLLDIIIIAVVLGIAAGILAFGYLLNSGLTAKPKPGPVETFVAQRLRNTVIGFHSRAITDPTPATPDTIAEGRAHFADHCAVCHGNDGSGNTEMGQGLYPKAPDMRLAATQGLTDGQLFYIIENGVRLTGMPGWSTGTKEGETESWHLVHFIRHLPKITPEELDEMKALNPRSPQEIRDEIQAEQFLQGGDTEPSAPAQPDHEGH